MSESDELEQLLNMDKSVYFYIKFRLLFFTLVKQKGDSNMKRLEYTVNYYEYTKSAYSGFWEVTQ